MEPIPCWQAEPKKCWQDLEKGKYHWSHTAMNYWPELAKEKCRRNKSFAIAHGLEWLDFSFALHILRGKEKDVR